MPGLKIVSINTGVKDKNRFAVSKYLFDLNRNKYFMSVIFNIVLVLRITSNIFLHPTAPSPYPPPGEGKKPPQREGKKPLSPPPGEGKTPLCLSPPLGEGRERVCCGMTVFYLQQKVYKEPVHKELLI